MGDDAREGIRLGAPSDTEDASSAFPHAKIDPVDHSRNLLCPHRPITVPKRSRPRRQPGKAGP